jgi:hypothetical protein
MNNGQLIEYIYNNIDKVKSTDNIIFFINSKNIPYSENKNGIFINISLLDTEITKELYELILSDLNKEIDIVVPLEEKTKKKEIPNIPIETKKYKDIKLNPLQINLLAYSRQKK